MKSDYCEACGTLFDQPDSDLSLGNVTATPNYVKIDGQNYHLPPQPLSVLRSLMRRKKISKESLFADVWGGDSDVEIKIVNIVVCRIRKLLAGAGATFEIRTIWGEGFEIADVGTPRPEGAPIDYRLICGRGRKKRVAVAPEPAPAPAPTYLDRVRARRQERRLGTKTRLGRRLRG